MCCEMKTCIRVLYTHINVIFLFKTNSIHYQMRGILAWQSHTCTVHVLCTLSASTYWLSDCLLMLEWSVQAFEIVFPPVGNNPPAETWWICTHRLGSCPRSGFPIEVKLNIVTWKHTALKIFSQWPCGWVVHLCILTCEMRFTDREGSLYM